MKKLFWLGLAALAPGVASADFLNGSFETPVLIDGTQMSFTGAALTDWTITNGTSQLITNQFVGDAVTWNPTPDGNQFLYINSDVTGGTVLSQTIALNAGSNTLNFLQADFGTNFESPGGQIDVTVLDGTTTVVGPQLFTTPNFSGFIAQQLTFNAASSGNYTFDFTSVAGHAAIIDGVTMAPEPTSMAALGLGLAALVLRRRTKAQ